MSSFATTHVPFLSRYSFKFTSVTNIRFESLANISTSSGDVRFTPKSGH